MREQYQSLFSPIRIGSCEIKNRYAMAPMGTFGLTDRQGIFNEDCIEYYVTRAKGGVGLIITGMNIVEDRYEKNMPSGVPIISAGVDHAVLRMRMQELTQRVHAYNCRIFLQMSAGFGRAAHIGRFCGGAVAPSPVANRFRPEIEHRALTTEEIRTYIDSFGREAAFAQSAGFDGVEVHALHEGYLLDQFATELFNRRTDQYGGSLGNRYRMAVEILQAIKGTCGPRFPVALRFSPKHCMKGIGEGGLPGEDYQEAGRDMPEGLWAAKYLEEQGYDAFDVDLGCYDAHFWSHPPVFFQDGMYLDAARQVRQCVSVPVLVSGRMDDPDLGARAIREGACDMVALGRALLADPELPDKIHAGEPEQVRTCISCNYGCSARLRTAGRIGCSVNAQCAQERSRRIFPALHPMRVAVVGGGPAGMEFARVSRLRGHEVILFERGPALGGKLIPASQAPFKHHDAQLTAWYTRQLAELGVDVRLNTPASPERLAALAPGCVAIACGAEPVIPPVPGVGQGHVYTVTQLLMDIGQAGRTVTVIGAGQAGVELALWLSSLDRQVTLVGRGPDIMKGGYHNAVTMAKLLLRRDHVSVLCNTAVSRIAEDGVYANGADGAELFIPADTVALAAGFRSDRTLYDQVKDLAPRVFLLGDADRAQNVYNAIHTAYETAYQL